MFYVITPTAIHHSDTLWHLWWKYWNTHTVQSGQLDSSLAEADLSPRKTTLALIISLNRLQSSWGVLHPCMQRWHPCKTAFGGTCFGGTLARSGIKIPAKEEAEVLYAYTVLFFIIFGGFSSLYDTHDRKAGRERGDNTQQMSCRWELNLQPLQRTEPQYMARTSYQLSYRGTPRSHC